MQPFRCAVCAQTLFFENTTCLQCGTGVGYDVVTCSVVPEEGRRRCANSVIATCNWFVHDGQELCASCRLTRVRPADDDAAGMAGFADAEQAKRRLLAQIWALGLTTVGRDEDPEQGLAFDLLASNDENVMTGHEDGVITLDLSESDDVHREQVRLQLGEPYRTVLGHLRHEIGHYFWPLLVSGGPRSLPGALSLAEVRDRFGDDTLDYAEEVERHYAEGPPDGWQDQYVSAYATMHPWEDWAETFAHYLHIRSGLDTAAAFGLSADVSPTWAALAATDPAPEVGVLVQGWLSLTFALNAMSRAIGKPDLYPFVLSSEVVDKLDLVHRAVESVSRPRS